MGISGLYIRQYQESDSAALASLFFHTVRTVSLGDYSRQQVEAWAPAERDMGAWAARFEGRHTFVAELEGEIAGFAELDPSGYLDRFYVAADFIGKGVGKELYHELERKALCLGIPRIHLESSIGAKPFFERCGFRVVREQVVCPGGVAMANFLMEKTLPAMEIIRRKAARVLLISPGQKVLLVKIANPSGGWQGWIAPGGGIEEGETEEEALRREMMEELDFAADGSERKVWHRKHCFPWAAKLLEQTEVYFLRHCQEFQPGQGSEIVKGCMPDFRELRWWKISDIEKSGEQFAPRRLGFFLRRLGEGLPAKPIDVGI